MRIKIFCSALVISMLNAVLLYAQSTDPGNPCPDPDGNCSPLDTWVMIFAAAVFILSIRHLYRRGRNSTTTSK